jgi:hypothetical protein
LQATPHAAPPVEQQHKQLQQQAAAAEDGEARTCVTNPVLHALGVTQTVTQRNKLQTPTTWQQLHNLTRIQSIAAHVGDV